LPTFHLPNVHWVAKVCGHLFSIFVTAHYIFYVYFLIILMERSSKAIAAMSLEITILI